jgi:Protein of unknown function (DUF1064)
MPNKYRNIPTVLDNLLFDSKLEAARYQELKLLHYAGEIGEIELQPAFPITINGVLICTYYADFAYPELKSGCRVIEDVKSEITRKDRAYRIKKKLVEALYGVTITEVC